MATAGKELSPDKAKEILRDGTVHGKPITGKQRGFFGARAGGAPVKNSKRGRSSFRSRKSPR